MRESMWQGWAFVIRLLLLLVAIGMGIVTTIAVVVFLVMGLPGNAVAVGILGAGGYWLCFRSWRPWQGIGWYGGDIERKHRKAQENV